MADNKAISFANNHVEITSEQQVNNLIDSELTEELPFILHVLVLAQFLFPCEWMV